MLKKLKITSILLLSLLLTIFITNNKSIEALSKEDSVEELIKVKQLQEVLKLQISNMDEDTNVQVDKSSNTNVITVSFIEEEINNKELLEAQLQQAVIEEVRIKKYIEQQKQEYLNTNNIEFETGVWPVSGYNQISSSYGDRIHPITGKLTFHKGIDIPAPEGTDILASDDGIVIFSGTQNGYGNIIKIQHFDGKITVYAHNDKNLVNKDDVIRKGQVIGKVGTTGNSTGNHLHFEVILDEETINPINAVNK